jgi:hypothetical protein
MRRRILLFRQWLRRQGSRQPDVSAQATPSRTSSGPPSAVGGLLDPTTVIAPPASSIVVRDQSEHQALAVCCFSTSNAPGRENIPGITVVHIGHALQERLIPVFKRHYANFIEDVPAQHSAGTPATHVRMTERDVDCGVVAALRVLDALDATSPSVGAPRKSCPGQLFD